MFTKLGLMVASIISFAAATAFAAETTYVFGFVAKNNDPLYQAVKTGAQDEAATLNKKGVRIKIDWRTPNEEDPQKQADAVGQLVEVGVDGIATSASDANTLTDAIDKAVATDIPVLTFDSDAPKSKRFVFVGGDDTDLGQKIMSELAAAMGDRGVVAILAGNRDAPYLEKRVRGVREEAKKYPDIKILDAFYHKEIPADAAAKVDQVMKAHPEIGGWAMIRGWPLFTDDAFKWKPGTVKVVAVDALPAELEYLKNGYVQVLLTQSVYEWGRTSVYLLYEKVVDNKNPPSTFISTSVIPITLDNVDAFSENWKKWTPKK